MNNKAKIYSLDIGGSSVKQAIVNPHNIENPIVTHIEPIVLESRKFNHLKTSIIQEISKNLPRFPSINVVAISTTGGVDDEKGIVKNAGHFEDYKNISWDKILRGEFSSLTKVFTVNDGKASSWAEFKSVENKHNYFIHFVIGTGIGGAVIVNGRFLVGDDGQAGRIGHIKVTDKKTIRCSCDSEGCVETVSSAPAIEYQYSNLLNSHNIKSNKDINFNGVVDAVFEGDKLAIEAVKIAGFYLGKVISTLMILFNPGVITLGGGVISALKNSKENIYVESAINSARLHAHKRVRDFTIIKESKYGNNAGLIGAAQLSLLGKVPK